jgi:urease accessory protein
MIEIRAKLKIPRGAYQVQVRGQLRLAFASRQAGHGRAQLVSGEEIELALPRGELLRDGDLVTASDGRVIEVLAVPEKLLHAECANAADLAKAAYYLGNLHVPLQVGEGFLRLAADRALEEALTKAGLRVTHVEAPFEPEAGADANGRHHHGHDHDRALDHDQDHGHAHGHAHEGNHDHDHGHGRGCHHRDGGGKR